MAISENYEDSFEYVIKAVSEDGRSALLCVYNVGQIHIGSKNEDALTIEAAKELIKFVSAAKPKDYERVVYYLDFQIKIDISVKSGVVKIKESEITDEKADELAELWYS